MQPKICYDRTKTPLNFPWLFRLTGGKTNAPNDNLIPGLLFIRLSHGLALVTKQWYAARIWPDAIFRIHRIGAWINWSWMNREQLISYISNYSTDTLCFFLIDSSRQCSLIYGGYIAKHLLLPCANLSYHSLPLVAAIFQLAKSCLVNSACPKACHLQLM